MAKGVFLIDDLGNPGNDGYYSEGIKTRPHYTKDKNIAGHTLAVKAVDWDNDGDFDLVLNTANGIKLSINKGNKRKSVFSSDFILLPLHPSHFAYDFVDWDGDGLWDIICGGKTGAFIFIRILVNWENLSLKNLLYYILMNR